MLPPPASEGGAAGALIIQRAGAAQTARLLGPEGIARCPGATGAPRCVDQEAREVRRGPRAAVGRDDEGGWSPFGVPTPVSPGAGGRRSDHTPHHSKAGSSRRPTGARSVGRPHWVTSRRSDGSGDRRDGLTFQEHPARRTPSRQRHVALRWH